MDGKDAYAPWNIKRMAQGADALWSINTVKVDADLIADAPNLKVIAQASVGYDNVTVDDLTARQIPYGNTPDVLTESVAELAFTLVAAASRRIVENADLSKAVCGHNVRPILKVKI